MNHIHYKLWTLPSSVKGEKGKALERVTRKTMGISEKIFVFLSCMKTLLIFSRVPPILDFLSITNQTLKLILQCREN